MDGKTQAEAEEEAEVQKLILSSRIKQSHTMKNAVNLLQYAVRLLALLQVALGFQFWSGRSFGLMPVHMRMGEALIVLLWILAGIGLWAGVKPGLVIGAIVYGFLTLAFAMNMGQLLPGGAHEVIRVLHLLIGLGAVGLTEILAARIKRERDVQRTRLTTPQ